MEKRKLCVGVIHQNIENENIGKRQWGWGVEEVRMTEDGGTKAVNGRKFHIIVEMPKNKQFH